MKRLGILLTLAHLFLQAANGQTRFAVVRFDQIAAALEVFSTGDQRLKSAIADIRKDPRFVQLQKSSAELNAILKQLQTSETDADKNKRVELATSAEALRKEIEALHEDCARFEAAEVEKIKRSLLVSVKKEQVRIRETVAKVAEERGFDSVFEVTGNSNTSVPVLIYAKNPTDITGDVIAILKAGQPAAPAKPDEPPAKPATPGKPAPKP